MAKAVRDAVHRMRLAQMPEQMIGAVDFREIHEEQIPVLALHQIKTDISAPHGRQNQFVAQARGFARVVEIGDRVGILDLAARVIAHLHPARDLGVRPVPFEDFINKFGR